MTYYFRLIIVMLLILWYGGAEAGKLILITPTEGTVGTIITVMGEGYGPTETVRVDFGGRLDVARVITSDEGTFTVTFKITPSPAGKRKFRCVGYKTLSSNEGYINVIGRIVSIEPTEGKPGTLITVKGDGYGAGEDIKISLGKNENILTGKANGIGAFTLVFTIDTQPAGKKEVKVAGLKTGIVNEDEIEIIGGITSVIPAYGSVGTVITVSGAGFGSKEKIKVDLGNVSNIAETTATEYGVFNVSFEVPAQPAGGKTIIAMGLNSRQVGMDRFVISPVITLVTPVEGYVGTKVRVEGNGFGASEPIRIDFNRSLGIGRGVTDKLGQFKIEFVVDAQPSDRLCRISAIGRHSRKLSFVDTFKILSRIDKIVPTSGTVGTKVKITGSGYNAGERVKIDFGQTATIGMVTTTSRGIFSAGFTVDTQPGGKKLVVATGLKSNIVSNIEFEIKPNIVSLVPDKAGVGDRVEIIGNGYGVTEVVRVDMGEIKSIAIIRADTTGSVYGTFIVPAQTGGRNKQVSLTGLTSNATATCRFEVRSRIVITPVTGTVGVMIHVEGSGFGKEEIVRVDLGKHLGIGRARTDESGNFTTEFKLKEEKVGEVRVVAIGLKSYNVGTAIFNVIEEKKKDKEEEIQSQEK